MEALDIKQTLYTTLLLLGFDPVALENKHRTVNFDKHMFNFANMRAIEEVLHLLLNKLDPAGCLKEFRDCWPLHDRKQEREFRRIATNWLERIAKNDPVSHLPRMISLPTSPYGQKVYAYFLCLARYVLHKQLVSRFNKKCYQDFVGHPPEGADVDMFLKMMTTLISKVRTRYVSRTRQTVEIRKQWETTMEMFVKSYRDDVKTIQDLKTKLSEKQTTEDDEVTVDEEKMSKVCGMIGRLEEFRKDVESKKEIFECHFDGSIDKYVIDGRSINISVPNQLVEECEHDIAEKKVNSVETDGKLDILSIIKLWNVSLKQCSDTLEQGGMPDLRAFDSKSEIILEKIKSSFEKFSKMSDNMSEEILPDLHNNVDQLFQQAKEKLLGNKSSEPFVIPSLGASGLSPPKQPKRQTRHKFSFDINLPKDSDAKEDRMAKLMKRIDEDIDRKAGEVDNIDLEMGMKSNIEHVADEELNICENISKECRNVVDEKYLVSSVKKASKPKSMEIQDFKRPPPSAKKPAVKKTSSSIPTSANIRDRLNAIKKRINPQPTNQIPPSLTNRPIASSHQIDDSHLDLMADKVVDQFIKMMSNEQQQQQDGDLEDFIKGLATPAHPVHDDDDDDEFRGASQCLSTNFEEDEEFSKKLTLSDDEERIPSKGVESLELRRMTAVFRELGQTQTPKISGRTRRFAREEEKVIDSEDLTSLEFMRSLKNNFEESVKRRPLHVLEEESFAESSSIESEESKRWSQDSADASDIVTVSRADDKSSIFEEMLPNESEYSNEEFDNFLPLEKTFHLDTPPSGRRLSKWFQVKADMEDLIFSPKKMKEVALPRGADDDLESSLLDLDGFDDTNLLN